MSTHNICFHEKIRKKSIGFFLVGKSAISVTMIFTDKNDVKSQRAHDVNTTSPQRRCNVMTLHQR